MKNINETYKINQSYNTDGEKTKRVETTIQTANGSSTTTANTSYYVNSSVTGKAITVLDGNGAKGTTNVYFGEAVLATQNVSTTNGNTVKWKHADPLTGSSVEVSQSGGLSGVQLDFEPLGAIVPRNAPTGGEFGVFKNYNNGGNAIDPGYGCESDGYSMPCEVKAALLNHLDRISDTIKSRIFYFEPTYPNYPQNWDAKGADNRYYDQNYHPGLRRVAEYDGRDFVGERWAVNNFKGFPCPPDFYEIKDRFYHRFRSLLQKESNHRDDKNKPLENGGWIYQKKNGSLYFKPVERKRRGENEIYLDNPPEIEGARVVAYLHTHPFTNEEQNNSLREQKLGPGFGTGPSPEDEILAANRVAPSIIIFEDYYPKHRANMNGDNQIGSQISIEYKGPSKLSQKGCD